MSKKTKNTPQAPKKDEKRLAIKREILRKLDAADLDQVAGGAPCRPGTAPWPQ